MAVERSPTITHLSWGKVKPEGLPEGKDYKLFPGGGREWDWRETGTRHRPGIQIGDVEELLDHGAEVLILSRGMYLALQTMPETLAYLAERGVEVHVPETRAAGTLYNELAATRAAAALIHSTC